MKSLHLSMQDGASVVASRFLPGQGAREFHLHVLPAGAPTFEEQLASLERAYRSALQELELDGASTVLRRLFLSDVANQEKIVRASSLAAADGPMALSVVEQPPLPERKIALWAYHAQDRQPLQKEELSHGICLHRGRCRHLFSTELAATVSSQAATPFEQTTDVFERYVRILEEHDATLGASTLRTWLFVQGIDHNYQGMVAARRELFSCHGLTDATHYIASTGIAGRQADPHRSIILDAYAVAGLEKEQVRFLSAPSNLGPASAYGVTFERGTRVDYGDRSHVFISGTASIDPEGQTLHVGDVQGQTARTFSNVEALLRDAGASSDDIVQMLVYLRDPADRASVEQYLDQTYPGTPAILLEAPVCRPSWLIEVECIAVIPNADSRWQPF